MAGGEIYANSGGGSNYLCLPSTPEFDEYQSGLDTHRGHVFSAEYEIYSFPPFASKHNHEVPCAVCQARNNRSGLVTIPAMLTCPCGWTTEYYGYLMTSQYMHSKKDFACVDRFPEIVSSGDDGNQDGALFTPVEVRCSGGGGNLPCSLYPDGREVSCVVCTK